MEAVLILGFCRGSERRGSSGWSKVFAEGTKLIVIPSDRRFDADISPKPTIFLPSVAETNLHQAGTYLCLLEKFFPDVIEVYWKEKDGSRTLESLQGDAMRTNDTYMTLSWLTVAGKSMCHERRCMVRHESSRKGADLETLFPPIKKAVTGADRSDCLEDSNVLWQLQLTSTSAYHAYLLLLLKSTVYSAIAALCLLRRAAVRGSRQSS